jgi:hypothetical protein
LKVKIEALSSYLICVGFLILYSLTLAWGLPQKLDADEYIFVFAAMEMFSPPYFHPGWFGAPASTLIDLLALVYGLTAILGTAIGYYDNVQEFTNVLWLEDGEVHYVMGRFLSALFSVFSLFLTYKISRKFTSFSISLCALILCGFSYLFVFYSAVIRMDMMQVFSLLFCAYYCIRLIDKNYISRKASITLGLFFAVSVFSKYPSITFVVPIIYTYVLVAENFKTAFIKFFTFGCAVCFFSFLISPYFFLDFSGVLSDIVKESRSYSLSATSLGFWASISKYYMYSLRENFGILALVIGSLGALVMLKNKRGHVILLSILPYLIFISSLSLWWNRWILPIIPFFTILVAIGLHYCVMKTKFRQTLWVIIPATTLLIFHNISLSSQLIKIRAQNNITQVTALKWIEVNIPHGSSILLDRGAPQMKGTQYSLYERDCKFGLALIGSERHMAKRAQAKMELNRCEAEVNPEIPAVSVNKDNFQQSVNLIQPEYLIRSNLYERYLKDISLGTTSKSKLSEYEFLFQNYTEIKAIIPSNKLSGPAIRIYKREYQ